MDSIYYSSSPNLAKYLLPELPSTVKIPDIVTWTSSRSDLCLSSTHSGKPSLSAELEPTTPQSHDFEALLGSFLGACSPTDSSQYTPAPQPLTPAMRRRTQKPDRDIRTMLHRPSTSKFGGSTLISRDYPCRGEQRPEGLARLSKI
ncbi:Hypothetical predicted protein [Pelobates cultripes]|uniref:Uncharacterized protein n=1 Tax=Pelobates cultripes TaxID=61616 RepID=A0AAD1VM10_PELCU|nr:Hypothetical predicted protein [Pelobates cultripes]